jgi:HrpA-like RNA helicase
LLLIDNKIENVTAFPLFSRLNPDDQNKIFEFDKTNAHFNGKARMVIFTTDIAETSLTFPGITLVIDSGL